MRALVFLLVLSLPGLSQQLVRVLSYNIHHAEGTDAVIDLARIANVIKSAEPDLVALQEVDIRTTRSLGVDQLLEIAHLTGLQPIYGRTISYRGGLYGNAVLSRLPANGFVNHDMPLTPGREARGVVEAVLHPPPGSRGIEGFHFMATHLDTNEADRLLAAARLREIVAERPSYWPMILAGDMNAIAGSKTIDALLADWTPAQGPDAIFTYPAGAPARQIDFIFVRPASRWRVVETRVIEEPIASDHRPILAVVELLPDPSPQSARKPAPSVKLR